MSSSPEPKIKIKNNETSPEDMIPPPAEISPPEIINISDDNDLSSIESFFMISKNEPTIDQPVPRTIKHKNEELPRTGHIETYPKQEIINENEREHDLTFSATCSEEIMKIKKPKKTKMNKNKTRTKSSSLLEQKK